MLINPLTYADLAGVVKPAEIVDRIALAKADVEKAEAALEANQAAIKKLADRPLPTEEIDKALSAGKDLSKLVAKHLSESKKRADQRAVLFEVAETLKGRLEGCKTELADAEKALDVFLIGKMEADRAKMVAQWERAMMERAKDMATTRGIPKSTPPKNQARSRIAVCEICKQPVGLFDPATICRPVMGAHFKTLPRVDSQPFPDAGTWEHLRCPCCGARRPFREPDKILTTAGFFVVPKEAAEATEREPAGDNTE